jgi:two-component system chemotaxis response regulator CheB
MSCELIVAGASLDAFHALQVVLGGLRADFDLPFVVVQHRSTDSEDLFPALLLCASRIPISEVEDKQPILPGMIYLAPANYHLLVEAGHFALSVDDPVSFARPSIDVLFESAADAYRQKVVGVLLNGAGPDGIDGLLRVKECGGITVVREPEPDSTGGIAVEFSPGAVDRLLPLQNIAPFLCNLNNSNEESQWQASRQAL